MTSLLPNSLCYCQTICDSMHNTSNKHTCGKWAEHIHFRGQRGISGRRLLPESLWKHSSKVRADKESETLRVAPYFLYPSHLFCSVCSPCHFKGDTLEAVLQWKLYKRETWGFFKEKVTHLTHWSAHNEAAGHPPNFLLLDVYWSPVLLSGTYGLFGKQTVGHWGMKQLSLKWLMTNNLI